MKNSVSRATPRRRRGLSLVEIVITLAVAALMLSIAITFYGEYQSGALIHAAQGDLDAIGKSIQTWQMENKSSFPHRMPPVTQSGDGRTIRDPWGNPYRVLPERALAYSFGPNGEDDGGTIDDVTHPYTPLTHARLPAPEGFRVSRQDADRVTLRWKPVFVKDDEVANYEIQRRDSLSPHWGSSRSVASSSFDFTDEGLSSKKTYYYRVRATTVKRTKGPWAGPVGYRIILSSGIQLSVTPSSASLLRGEIATFHVRAQGSGAALREVRFDGKVMTIHEGRVDTVVEKRFDVVGRELLVLRGEDTMGNKESVNLEVEIHE